MAAALLYRPAIKEEAAADRLPRDGDITVLEWFDYAVSRVPHLQVEAMNAADQQGRVLRFDAGPQGSSGGLQTPRVFSRRDDGEPPFVVARP